MKNLLVALLGFALPASAFAWVPLMQFQVTPQTSQVQVMNPYAIMAFCQGYVYGQVQNGMVVNSWFSSYVPAGGYAYAYVYATPPFFFVNAWANIQCQ